MSKSIFGNNGANFGVGDHYWFEIEGKKFIYCYINKNACSLFKYFICDISPFRENLAKFRNHLHFMRKYHRVDHLEDFLGAEHVIFVYRNPIERALSLYKNKFVDRKGHTEIFLNYFELTQSDPNEASFREFVFNYLARLDPKIDPHCYTQYSHLKPVLYTNAISMNSLYEEMKLLVGEFVFNYLARLDPKIDPHCYTQYSHLKPVLYTNAISMNSLYEEMKLLVGDHLGEKYFRKKINRSIYDKRIVLEPSIEKKLCEIYKDDLDMIYHLENSP